MSGRDGGSAFPIWNDDMPIEGSPGMSLRDYFAGQALAGALAWAAITEAEADRPADDCPQILAEKSYQIADAMLAERTPGGEAP